MAVRCGAVKKLQSEGNATGGVPRGSIQPHQQLPHGYIGFEFDEQYLRPDYCSARSANYAVRFEVYFLSALWAKESAANAGNTISGIKRRKPSLSRENAKLSYRLKTESAVTRSQLFGDGLR